jgi:hypothetical protein
MEQARKANTGQNIQDRKDMTVQTGQHRQEVIDR